MADPFLGEIRAYPYNFAPRNWALCNGQLLPIAQHTALFSLLGTTYGGNGQTTFALPDLQGRVALGQGQGPGLSSRSLGEEGGTDGVALAATQIPPHTHSLNVSSQPADAYSPGGEYPAKADRKLYGPAQVGQFMDGNAVTTTGSGDAHENRRPVLAITYCIALAGIYPSRD